MATKPTKPQEPQDLPVMEAMERRRFGPKEADDYGDDEDVDSLGIGTITIADLAEILEDESPTDEMPIIQEDGTFI